MIQKLALAVMLLLFCIAADAFSANKVVVVPLNSSGSPTRLWGEGRPGSGATRYPADGGVTIARSWGTATWDGAAAVCPKNTWVCTLAEANNLKRTSLTLPSAALRCDGTAFNNSMAWVQDEYGVNLTKGIAVSVVEFLSAWVFYKFYEPKCENISVWCCSAAN